MTSSDSNELSKLESEEAFMRQEINRLCREISYHLNRVSHHRRTPVTHKTRMAEVLEKIKGQLS